MISIDPFNIWLKVKINFVSKTSFFALKSLIMSSFILLGSDHKKNVKKQKKLVRVEFGRAAEELVVGKIARMKKSVRVHKSPLGRVTYD